MRKKGNAGLKKMLGLIAVSAAAAGVFMVSGMAEAKATRKLVLTDTLSSPAKVSAFAALYDSLKLDSLELSREAYSLALRGYENLVSRGAVPHNELLSIVDFSLPSSKKRLFIINMHTGKLLFNTFVSHGKNSGKEQATKFSNDLNSFQSSLGFYLTGNTYRGEHGFSLRLEGLEKGINDNATNRGIVIHAANYVNEKMASSQGFIGRSLGCPAVPVKLHKPIINAIKGGSCLFIYGADANYLAQSSMMTDSSIFANILAHDSLIMPGFGA